MTSNRRLARAALLVGVASLSTLALAQSPDVMKQRSLAATCANCHGMDGNAKGDMKPLAGVSADKIVAQINDFKSGAQPATIMHQIAKGYTDEQIKLIAAYFAAQTKK